MQKRKGIENRLKYAYYIDRKTGCWVGTTQLSKYGYCRIYVDGYREMLHRYMYERYFGKIPVGYELDHRCNNRKCCNIFHLHPVTPLQNVRRSANCRHPQDYWDKRRR